MLDSILGDVPTPLKFILIFAFVIALIFIAAWVIRRFGGQRFSTPTGAGRSRQPRLGVLDVLNIDGRRRLVIVRRDNVEHLVMIGGPNDVVVESGILRAPAGATAQRDAPPLVPAEPPAARPTTPPQTVPAPQPKVAPPRVADAPPVSPAGQRTPAPTPAMTPSPAVQPAPRPALAPGQARPAAPAVPAPPAAKPAAPAAVVAKPAAAENKPAAPAAPKPAAPAPAAAAPAPAAPIAATPAPTPAPQPIIAGPGPRPGEPGRANELAERLAAALKRPVAPVSRPEPAADAKPVEAGEVDELPREMPPMAPQPAAPSAPPRPAPAVAAPAVGAPTGSAPEVKPEKRAEPQAADDDEFSLEAEMANLLGRDVGKPRS